MSGPGGYSWPVWSDIAPHSSQDSHMRRVWRDGSPHFRLFFLVAHCVEQYCSTRPLVNVLRVLCGASLLHTSRPDARVVRRCSTRRVQAGIRGLCGAGVFPWLGENGLDGSWANRPVPSPCSSALGNRFQVDGLSSHSPLSCRPFLPQPRATGFIGLSAENPPPSTAQGVVSGLREERVLPSTRIPAGFWLRAEFSPNKDNA